MGYPNFLRLLSQLEVGSAVADTDMSFTFHNRDTGFQFAFNGGWNGLLCQRRNLFRPAFYRLLAEIRRFRAEMDLDSIRRISEGKSIEGYFRDAGYSDALVSDFIYPYAASLWSLPDEGARSLPSY